MLHRSRILLIVLLQVFVGFFIFSVHDFFSLPTIPKNSFKRKFLAEKDVSKEDDEYNYKSSYSQSQDTALNMCGDFKGYPAHEEFHRFEALKNHRENPSSWSPRRKKEYFHWCQELKFACMRVQIRNGRIFVRHLYPGYQSRHRATLLALYRVSMRFHLPDADIILELSDGMWDMQGLPIFRIARPAGARVEGVLYPDFTFYNWPESVCKDLSHDYEYLFEQYKKASSLPFEKREGTLFWRGGQVHNPIRPKVVDMMKDLKKSGDETSQHIDIEFMQWVSASTTGDNIMPGCVGLVDACRYKYLAFLEGNTYSSRLKYLLLCGSVVFMNPVTWHEWWTQQLTSEHVAQVRPDWTDSKEKFEQVLKSEDGGAQIAAAGIRFARENLSPEKVDCYWKLLIDKANRYLPREELSPKARPIEDVLLYGNTDKISEE